MINRDRLLEEFLELVRTDSETGDERAICDLLKEKLTALGLAVTEDGSATATGHGAGNLVATLEGMWRMPPSFTSPATWTPSPREKG